MTDRTSADRPSTAFGMTQMTQMTHGRAGLLAARRQAKKEGGILLEGEG